MFFVHRPDFKPLVPHFGDPKSPQKIADTWSSLSYGTNFRLSGIN